MPLERWDIDPRHSEIRFSVRHMVVARVRGRFSRWGGTLEAEDGDLSRASVAVRIDASSLGTGDADRDAHLTSRDFLDVAGYPEATFRGTVVRTHGDRRFEVRGALTVHGVTRDVTLDVEHAGTSRDPGGHGRVRFAATTSLDRKDFGLAWNKVLEAGGVLVGDRIDVEIEVEAVRQAASKSG